MKKLVVTGCAGLIGSEVCTYFSSIGWSIYGIDNNMREVFFGKVGETKTNLHRLSSEVKSFYHFNVDIRDRDMILSLFKSIRPDAVVHTAAQPSHDLASSIPFEDFETNALGTLNLLEATRRVSLNIPFVHLSTNKVYGDGPNLIEMVELDTRWMFNDANYSFGIPENFPIDQSTHSLFGASKLSADIYVQEYGRYFKMPTCCLRGGCLTGPFHSGVELHGFLSYLVKTNYLEKQYTVFGYKGKQLRDNIHASDVARFIHFFIENPTFGEVYNIGGGIENSCSILEAFKIIEAITHKEMKYVYVNQNRIGDHICYFSDLRKIKKDFPSWSIEKNLAIIFQEIYLKFKNQD
jgi:CDP-paratose 2-epimerase